MSQFSVTVVPIKLEPHPNADSLSLVRIFDAYVCCVRTSDWEGIDLGAFIPPDSIVPNTPEFAFLDGNLRIKAKKLRGIVSQGLLVPAPPGSKEGDDVAEILGIHHYQPETDLFKGRVHLAPPIPGPYYDIESWFKYRSVLEFYGSLNVVITEKIHGTNSRFTFQQNEMWCASHSFYRKENLESLYWKALRANSWVEDYCRSNPDYIVYGEVFGYKVQKLEYGATPGSEPMFRIFDVFEGGQFLDWVKLEFKTDQIVPVLYRGPYNHEIVEKLMSGKSTLAGHIREGVVIKPDRELWHERLGRVILKAVSPEYLMKS